MREQHVVWLDVAVNDAPGVGIGESAGNVAQNADAIGDRDGCSGAEPRTQRLAFDEGHHVIRNAVGFAGGEQRNDVRLLEGRRDPDLPLESIDADAGRKLGREHLDDDRALKARVNRGEDARHAAAAELAVERVRGPEGRLELAAKVRQDDVGPPGVKGVLVAESRSE